MSASEQTFSRRASYGPSSPKVGTRGARTTSKLSQAALQSFAAKGFHGTSVEDIATLAGTSRATLYQYFESKEAIFIGLMGEAGAALMRVTRRLGKLGPTAAGLDSLHWWLGEWSWVFDRYAAMFIEWANVNSPKAPLRPRLAEFVESHTKWFSDELATAGFVGCDPQVMATLVLGVTSRYNYIRHVYRPGLPDARLLESLAIAMQLALFPDTPLAVLQAGPQSVESRERPESMVSTPTHAIGPLAELPLNVVPLPSPLQGLSGQAGRTVRLLLDAAGRVFADTGYEAANIDQIVTEAGLARGTFYRYFDDKLELIIALATECATDMHDPFIALANVPAMRDPGQLQGWLHEFLGLQQRYAGVLRAWTEGFPIDPQVLAPCRTVMIDLSSALRELFGPPRDYGLDRRAGGMMLAALLEHFPDEGKGTSFEPSADQIVQAQALFINRVLLSR